MKTQNLQNPTKGQITNNNPQNTILMHFHKAIQNFRTVLSKLNKNLSSCGAAAASAIRN
jgi:hypothetical protein